MAGPAKTKSREVKLLEKHSKMSMHYWTGHDLHWYFPHILKPIIYLSAVNMIVSALGSHASMAYLVDLVFVPLIFLAEIIVYGWLGASMFLLTAGKTLPAGMRFTTSALSGALTGLSLGIVMVFFRIFWFREMWTFFNIVTEPGVRFVEGLLVAGLVAVLTMIILKLRK